MTRFLLSITNEQIPSILYSLGRRTSTALTSSFCFLLVASQVSGLTMSHFSFPHLLSNYLPLLFLLLLFLLLLLLFLAKAKAQGRIANLESQSLRIHIPNTSAH